MTKEDRKIRYHLRRQAALLYLGGRCVECGTGIVDYPGDKLHFDHIDPKTKVFAIGDSIGMSDKKFWVEVEKCQLLCAPCHDAKTLIDGSHNASKTHCRGGHLYDESNTYVDALGKRHCRKCRASRERERRKRR